MGKVFIKERGVGYNKGEGKERALSTREKYRERGNLYRSEKGKRKTRLYQGKGTEGRGKEQLHADKGKKEN